LASNYALQRTLSIVVACSARAASEFARAALTNDMRGAAERER